MCRSFLVTVVPLVYFCFCSLCFWCYIQKSLTRPMPRSLPPKSSRSFTLSALTFKSLIHFEWFCEWYKTVVQFYFSACSFLVFWRDCPFPIECSWLPWQIVVDHVSGGLFLSSLYCFIGLPIFMPTQCFLNYYSFVV